MSGGQLLGLGIALLLLPAVASAAVPLDALSGRDPFRFVVYGDTRDGVDIERQVIARMVDEAPDLAVETGDVVPAGDDEPGWRQFLDVEGPLLSRVPVLFTVGNHELYRDPTGEHLRRYLPMPTPRPASGRFYYERRVGGLVFIVLDGNGDYAEQTAWLAQRLSAAATDHARHVFVVVHQPPFSVGGHCGAAVRQADWVALFERFSVRAVFAGHNHAYERLERNGVRYFVSGGGGAELYDEQSGCAPFDIAARRTYRAEHHYLRVDIRGDDVEVAAMPIDPRLPPLEVTRFGAEPAAASWGPPLVDRRTLPLSGRTGRLAGLAGGVLGGLAILLIVRRRRPSAQ